MKFPSPNRANYKVAATFIFLHVLNTWKEDKDFFSLCFVGAVWLVLIILELGKHLRIHLPLWQVSPCLPMLQTLLFSVDELAGSS